MHTISRRHLVFVLAATAGALVGCARIVGPQTLVYTPQELTRLWAGRFPLERRLLEVLDVRIEQPSLSVAGQGEPTPRLATRLQVQAKERLFASRWQGQLALESGLRFEPSDQSLRLKGVRVVGLTPESGALAAGMAQRLGAALAESVLEDMALYHLSVEQRERAARLGFEVAGVRVVSEGVEVRWAPKR